MKTLSFDVSSNDMDLLENAAKFSGISLEQFIVQNALQKAETVLIDKSDETGLEDLFKKEVAPENVIKLSEKDAEWFFNLLENPPVPNEALIKLMSRPNRFIVEIDNDVKK